MFSKALLTFAAVCSCYLLIGQTTYTKRNGKMVMYDGDMRISGTVADYYANGKFEYAKHVAVNGHLEWCVVKRCSYKKGLLDGSYCEFDLRGDTVVSGMYSDNKKSGEWRSYRSQVLVSRCNYKAGKQVGPQVYYGSNKSVQRKELYAETGDRYYTWNYSSTAQLHSKGNCVNGKKDGEWRVYDTLSEYHLDSFAIAVTHYKEGKLHGTDETFVHGKTMSHTEYANGELHGARKVYRNNVLTVDESYSMGKLHGEQKKYAFDGKQYYSGAYVQGKPDGAHVTYDTVLGTLIDESNYEKGILLNQRVYSAEHKLVKEQLLFERDSLVYTVNEYYENGAKKSAGRLIGTRRTGLHEAWARNGKKTLSANFRNDRFWGTVEVWNEKGVKIFRSKAANGRDTMPEDVWTDAGVKLQFNTTPFEERRMKCIPAGLVPYYEEIFVQSDIIVRTISPISPAAGWTTEVDLGGHFVGLNYTLAEFPGGADAKRNFFEKNISYPESEREERIEGKNVVTFTVLPDGSVTCIDLQRSLSPGCDAEALRLIRAMPKWTPTVFEGTPRETRLWIQFDWRVIQREQR